MTILATIIVLGVLIFVHELGHFLAARSVGVRVERFSIGLGPRLFGFVRGETEYVISAIPLGGYVKMGGMDDEVMEAIEGGKTKEGADVDPDGAARPSDAPAPSTRVSHGGEGSQAEGEGSPPRRLRTGGEFDSKPVWARAWVISAGVIMNMLFAFVVYTAVAAFWGNPELDTTRVGGVQSQLLPDGAGALASIPLGASLIRIGDREVTHWGEVRDAILGASDGDLALVFSEPEGEVRISLQGDEARQSAYRALEFWSDPVIQAVNPGTPADRAGLRSGDRILAVDGVRIGTWPQFVSVVQGSPGVEIEISVERDGGSLIRRATPSEEQQLDPTTGEPRTIGQIGVFPLLPGVAYTPVSPVEAVGAGWSETVFISGAILGFLRDLVTGQISARNLGSIVAIGEASGQAAAEGLPIFLRFMALFSVNLAILNLLPIPVLDGGHLVFLGIEAVRGRPLSVEQRLRWSQVGFVVLIGIMVLALGNDFLRLFGL